MSDHASQTVGFHAFAKIHTTALHTELGDSKALEQIMHRLAHTVSLYACTVVQSMHHFFAPGAATGALLLAESHLTFHSWPEHNTVYIDMFACGVKRSVQQESIRLCIMQIATEIFHGTVEDITLQAR
jgi:S-adenosylmethionine decarboxylase